MWEKGVIHSGVDVECSPKPCIKHGIFTSKVPIPYWRRAAKRNQFVVTCMNFMNHREAQWLEIPCFQGYSPNKAWYISSNPAIKSKSSRIYWYWPMTSRPWWFSVYIRLYYQFYRDNFISHPIMNQSGFPSCHVRIQRCRCSGPWAWARMLGCILKRHKDERFWVRWSRVRENPCDFKGKTKGYNLINQFLN